MRQKLDALGERWPWFGVVLGVIKRYGEVHGNNLAAAVTLQSFVALFPLLLVAIAIVGFVSAEGVDIAASVANGLGLQGDAAKAITDAVAAAEDSRKAASIVGLAGLAWSGLGLVDAIQNGLNQIWQVRPRGIKDKLVGAGWLLGAAAIMVVGAGATALVGLLPGFMSPIGFLFGFAVNFCLWIWTAKLVPNRHVGWGVLVPGALLGAGGLELLKAIAGFYVPRMVASSSQLYGTIGVVFAVLAWLYLLARLAMYTAVLDVVLFEKHEGTRRVSVEVPALEMPEGNADRVGRVSLEKEPA
ncbi:MAG TPA: YihY/virulence factor BrkB family protein [Acidimicrobiales bacterium]|nr:YihY/virulence factor BrkB family protein [Acidimicrobiales bacterium]